MSELKGMIVDLLSELRMNSRWNEELWKKIYNSLQENIGVWKKEGYVPKSIVPYLLDMTSALSGGNRFADDATLEKMFEAEMEILEAFYELYDEDI